MAKDEKIPEETTTNVIVDMLRVTPEPPKNEKFYKSDRLTDLLIILFIFGIAMWFRFYVRSLFHGLYGPGGFNFTIGDGDPLGFGKFLGLKPGQRTNSEGYYDFMSYYEPYVDAYADGWNPYTGSRTKGDNIAGYVYGPFYIISISIGKIWFGLNTTDSIVFSNIILDSLTWVMVYILAKRVTGNIIAMIFAVVGSFSPIMLYYIAYRGLNAPIMNFAFLLFIWAYLEKRDNLTMFFLAFSLLTKQFPLFMAMPIGFWMVRRYGFFKGVAYYLKFFISVLLLSIPYILLTPKAYVLRLFAPGGGKSTPTCPQGSEATNLFHGMIPFDACHNADGELISLQLDLMPPGFEFFFKLVNGHILFFGSLIILAWIGFTAYDYFEERPRLYFVFIAAYYGVAHATIARGIYKYYITFLVPLFVLGFIIGDRKHSPHIRLGYLLNKGWRTWFNPQYRQQEPTPQFWLLGFNLLAATTGVFWLVHAAVNLFTFNTNNQLLYYIIFIPLVLFTIIRPGSKPEERREEFVTVSNYSIHVIGYLAFAAIGGFLLNQVAHYYFSDASHAIRNIVIMVSIILLFVLIPITQKLVTGKSKLFSPFTFNYLQLLLDALGIVIVYFVLKFFHVQIFMIYRFDTTFFLLLFSIIPLALLGKQVWKSAIIVPYRFINRVNEIRDYASPRRISNY